MDFTGGRWQAGGMFTGLVENTGQIDSFDTSGEVRRLRLGGVDFADEIALGDSIAVNGCCLTVVEATEDGLGFDLLAESVVRTSFADLKPGDLVNLERSLKADGRFGGHVVSGHIDACLTAEVFEPQGNDHYLRIGYPRDYAPYLVEKGSVSVDGVSLTVADLDETAFGIWLIPHTMQVTRFHRMSAGDRVNIEFDMLAKIIAKQVSIHLEALQAGKKIPANG